jgi:hypothetical protein
VRWKVDAVGLNREAQGTLRLVVHDSSCPARLSASALPVWFAVVRARRTNRGLVHLGDASVTPGDPGLEPGRTVGMRGDPQLDLAEVFMLADIGGDGVEAVYARCGDEPASPPAGEENDGGGGA